MYYIAPTYRAFTILKDDIYEDKKRYGIIDYKGKEKKIRLWDKPQKSWKDSGEPIGEGKTSNTKFIINEDGTKSFKNDVGKTFAERYGFESHGYIWFFEADDYGQKEIVKYLEKNKRNDIRRDPKLGLFTSAKVPPVIQGVTFVRINKEDVLIDDNTLRSDAEIKKLFEERDHHPIHIFTCGRFVKM